MKQKIALSLMLAVMSTFFSCHPLSVFGPRAIKTAKISDHDVQVAIDSFGVPFIKAETIHDAIYGLGFMHARDRLFQLDLIRHAALGKTAELFGERALKYDRKLRILSYKLDEQVANLSKEELEIIDHYLRGINDGAQQRGKTAEHFFLGVSFEPMTRNDVIAIARLQSWQLGADLYAEITNLKIARSDLSPLAKAEIIGKIDDRGTAIIKNNLLPSKPQVDAMNIGWPRYLEPYVKEVSRIKPSVVDDNEVFEAYGSNAWVVAAQKTNDGYAWLMNDPHLPHNFPSNFYLTMIQAGNFFAAGASFVGLPGILIGSSSTLSWGATASYINTEDGVMLTKEPGDKNLYLVDNQKISFDIWPQQFCTNKKGSCINENFLLSVYGPVLEHRIEKWIDEDDAIAIQWTGFHVEQHRNFSLPFLQLAQAPSVEEGLKIVNSMTLPGINLVLADTAGNIGYGYAGLVPKRDAKQYANLPLDGCLSSSKWAGFLDKSLNPTSYNPHDGYIVTANQNIFSNQEHSDFSYGQAGVSPFRALRIQQRMSEMLLDDKRFDFDELSLVQLDETSIEAKEMAPLIGAICVQEFSNADSYRKNFAHNIHRFDGVFKVDSRDALPYELLMREIENRLLKKIMHDTSPLYSVTFKARQAVKSLLYKNLQGVSSHLFVDDSARKAVALSCEPAFKKIVSMAGKREWTWRYGRHHYVQRRSPLSQAPIIGSWFRDRRREVSGSISSPKAESGLPVSFGANLRWRVKMTSPPELYAVIDTGNSGTIGDSNMLDQAKLWHQGKSLRLPTDFAEAKAHAKKFLRINAQTIAP